MSADKKLKKLAENLKKLPNEDYSFIAKKISERIVKRTQTGKGVNESGSLYSLPALSDSYQELRKKKRSLLGPRGTPKKSNLTASGKMLQSIKYVIKRSADNIAIIFSLEGTTKGLGNKPQNTSDVAKWQEDQGRRFFDISKTESNGILREVRNKVRDFIAKNFNK